MADCEADLQVMHAALDAGLFSAQQAVFTECLRAQGHALPNQPSFIPASFNVCRRIRISDHDICTDTTSKSIRWKSTR